jgi:hypothetical protein
MWKRLGTATTRTAILVTSPCCRRVHTHCSVFGVWRHGEMEVYLHAFLTSVLDGGECQLHAKIASPVGKAPHYLIDKILNGPQNESGGSERRRVSCSCRKSNPDSLIVQAVAWSLSSELLRLHLSRNRKQNSLVWHISLRNFVLFFTHIYFLSLLHLNLFHSFIISTSLLSFRVLKYHQPP